jgi:DHA3 family macrolide efflux protein-like MFS transporter
VSQQAVNKGMPTFLIIWIGQVVSFIGSGLTNFALGVWVYQLTGSVTQFALISMFIVLPGVLVSPFAGALVDRWDRRWAMIFSDVGSGAVILVVALLLAAGRLEIWHIYLALLIRSTFGAFRWPAYSAAIPLLVPKQQLGRVNGMVQMGQALGPVISPLAAGVLVTAIGVEGVILIDVATFVLALVTLLVVRLPQPERVNRSATGQGSLLKEVGEGLRYLKQRPGLMGLLLLFAIINFMVGIVSVLATPLVLSFAPASVLGTVIGIGGMGMLVGSVALSIWGGPKRRINGVLGFTLLAGFCIMLGGLRPSAVFITVAAFIFYFCFPIISGSSQAIWQSKVALDLQGRIFSLRNMVAMSCMPVAYLVAGSLSDYIFEPLMAEGGALASSVGSIIGVGPGRGIGLLFIVLGILTMIVAAVSYSYSHIRLVESELPDVITDKVAADATGDGQAQKYATT